MAVCKTPEIPFASGVDQNLSRLLSPIKETLDIWAGRAGDELCRVVTIEDLLDEVITVNISGSGSGSGNDADAIHDNVAGEINAIALKASPVSADVLLIEDSADSFNKKRISYGSIAASGTTFSVSVNDTTPGYLEDKFIVSHGTNTTNPLELSTLNDGTDEDRQLQFDEAKVDHDQLLNFLAAEHIDWALTGAEDIHVDRITATAVTQHVGSIDHNSLLNTHNLTTDIDHDQLTNFVAGEHTDAQVKVSANDSTPGYLEDKIVVSSGTNTTNILELSTLNDGLNEDVQLQIDEAKINHANLLNLTTGDPHTQYQQESEKGSANGYAGLGATTLVPTAELATGTANNTTFLRGDGTWSVPAGSGDVSKVGTPVDDQVGVWTGDGTIEGTSGLTYSGTVLDITGNLTLSGTVDGIDIATDVAANTLKVTNATHTGEVTGSAALSLDSTAISNQVIVTALGTDYVLIGDTSDAGNLKRALISDFAGGSHTITSHSDVVDATGAQLEELTGGGDTTLHDHTGITENTAARHTQGTDTTLGIMTADINMNSLYQVVGLQAPAAAGEAIRQTINITEANLTTLTDNSIADALHRHSELVASDGTPDPALSVGADGNVTITDGLYLKTDEVRAYDAAGLSLKDDSGTLGVFIEDGGQVGIGHTVPTEALDVEGDIMLSGNSIRAIKMDTQTTNASHLYFVGAGDANAYFNFIGTGATSEARVYAFYGGSYTANNIGIVHDGTDGWLSTGAGILRLHPTGTSVVITTGKYLTLGGNAVNEFSTDGTMAGNSDIAVPTEKAVKTYVNGAVGKSYVKVSDVKTNTDGGTFTSGAWQTRTLNTEDSDTDGICTLSSNQITLSAGTYECRISAPGFGVNQHVIRLQNVTGTITLINGTSEYATSYVCTRSIVVGKFTIAASQALEVQHYCGSTKTDDGFGFSTAGATTDVYTIAEFWKVG